MTFQVIEGKKDEIVEKISRINGQVTRAIVWVEDAAPTPRAPQEIEKILADLDKDTVSVGFVDDSREALYTPMEDE
jgi:predicted AAA+ superfamily ATPase